MSKQDEAKNRGLAAVRVVGGERATPLTSGYVYALAVNQADLTVREVLTAFALTLAYEEDEREAARNLVRWGRTW